MGNSEQSKTRVRLAVLDEFVCVGSDCPESCCRRFRIDIDERTLARWQRLPDSELRQRIEQQQVSENGAIFLRRREDGSCPFWLEGLCEIQQQYGHDHIPEICQRYPRVVVGRESSPVASAYLSCPEVVRLLLDTAGTQPFIGLPHRLDLDRHILQQDSLQAEKLLYLLLQALLGSGDVSIGEAVYVSSMKLVELLQGKNFSRSLGQLEQLCFEQDSLLSLLQKTRKSFRNRQLLVRKGSADVFWSIVLRTCRPLTEASYVQLLQQNDLYDAFMTDAEDTCTGLYTRILSLRRKLAPFDTEVYEGLKRYLQVKLVNHGFPLACHQDRLVLTWLECLSAVAQVLLLLCLHGRQQAINLQLLGQVIYRVERSLTHNTNLPTTLARHSELMKIEDFVACFMELA